MLPKPGIGLPSASRGTPINPYGMRRYG